MPVIIDWPVSLKFSDRSDPMLIQNNISSGEAIDGTEQIRSALSQRWKWRLTVPIHNAATARSVRIVKSKIRGRFNYLRIPICDAYRITPRSMGYPTPSHGVPHSDGAFLSDGSGYQRGPIETTLTRTNAAGSEVIRVRAEPFRGQISAGVWISINDWLYLIEDWTADGSSYLLNISPPLRDGVTISAKVDLEAKAIWIVTGDDVGDYDLNVGKFGAAQFSLIEPVGRDL